MPSFDAGQVRLVCHFGFLPFLSLAGRFLPLIDSRKR